MFSLYALHVENYKFYTTSTLYSRRQSKKIEMVCLFWDMLLYFSKIKKVCYNDYTMYSTELLWENILLHCLMMMSKLNV